MPSNEYVRTAVLTVAAILLAFGFVYLTAASAHDAVPTKKMPLGWTYPWSCCSGMDCRQVPATAIGQTPEGYVIKATGEVIPYGSKKIKDSPDGEFHWCSKQGKDDGETICLFIPPPSY